MFQKMFLHDCNPDELDGSQLEPRVAEPAPSRPAATRRTLGASWSRPREHRSGDHRETNAAASSWPGSSRTSTSSSQLCVKIPSRWARLFFEETPDIFMVTCDQPCG